MRLFGYENGFFKWVNRITDMIILSVLWTACCVPIITAGASTSATYYAIQKYIKHERGKVFQIFREGLRQNIRQSLIAAVILLVLAALLYYEAYLASAMSNGLRLVFLFLLIVVCVFAFWLYSYISRFDNNLRGYVLNTIYMMFRHFPVSISIGVIGFASFMVLYTFPFLLFIVPSVTIWFLSIMTERVFRRYMSEEDKEKEDERYEDYRDEYIGKHQEERREQRETTGQSRRIASRRKKDEESRG